MGVNFLQDEHSRKRLAQLQHSKLVVLGSNSELDMDYVD
jgi:hypothetical protein